VREIRSRDLFSATKYLYETALYHIKSRSSTRVLSRVYPQHRYAQSYVWHRLHYEHHVARHVSSTRSTLDTTLATAELYPELKNSSDMRLAVLPMIPSSRSLTNPSCH
jgi:hypothetical protein